MNNLTYVKKHLLKKFLNNALVNYILSNHRKDVNCYN